MNIFEFNPVTSEICHNDTIGKYVGNVTMCPECEKYCPYWRLDKSCSLSKVAYVFDNYGTVVFSIVMSIWAVVFLELWTRKQAVIAWQWDLTKFEEDEPLRPQYEAKVQTKRINPVTKKAEPYLPPHQKNKACTGVFVCTFYADSCFGNRHCRYGIPSLDDTSLLQMVSKCRKCCGAGSQLILKFVCDLFCYRHQLDLYCDIEQALLSCCEMVDGYGMPKNFY